MASGAFFIALLTACLWRWLLFTLRCIRIVYDQWVSMGIAIDPRIKVTP